MTVERDPVAMVVNDFIPYLAARRVIDSASGMGGRRGVNLSNKRYELGRLIAECRSHYDDAVEDLAARENPPKFSRDFRVHPAYAEYYTSADIKEEFDQTWAFYARRRGRPGRTAKGLLVAPLHPVYILVRDWWVEHVGPFNADYTEDEFGTLDVLERHTPAARLLLLIAQDMDYRFGAETCKNLHADWPAPAKRPICPPSGKS